MRKLQKPPVGKTREKKQEPLAEGLQITVPTDPSGRRLWNKMGDEEIVEYARELMEEKGISGRGELNKADSGLYRILRRRKLLDEIGFADKRRSWNGRSDEEVVDFAKKLMGENGISGRKELAEADPPLYTVLRKRGLLDKVGFVEKQRKQRTWKDVSDEEIVEFARKVMEKKEITKRGELISADHGLYEVLRIRGLLDKVGFVEKQRKGRSWKDVSDEEIVEFARKFMRKNDITKRSEVYMTNRKLYSALRKRGLLDKVGFVEKQRKQRTWKDVSDEEVVEFAQKFMRKNGITGRRELAKADQGLYEVLRNRKLMDNVGFDEKRRKGRSWKDLSDEEVVDFAKSVVKEKKITKRDELKKADSGLYEALRKRGLLDQVFAHIDQQRTDQARDAVIDALTKFANSEKEVEVA